MSSSLFIRVLLAGAILVLGVGSFRLWLVWTEWICAEYCGEFERSVGPLPRPGRVEQIRDSLPVDYLVWETLGQRAFVTFCREPIYYLVSMTTDESGETIHVVDVYRLEVSQAPYSPRTKLAGYYAEWPGDPKAAVGDFIAFLLGGESFPHEVRYRLIHSSP